MTSTLCDSISSFLKELRWSLLPRVSVKTQSENPGEISAAVGVLGLDLLLRVPGVWVGEDDPDGARQAQSGAGW